MIVFMSDVLTNFLESSRWELDNQSYAKEAAYRMEAIDIFGISSGVETDSRYNDGEAFYTKLISRDNNMASIAKAGNRNHEQNTPDEVSTFAQAYTRLEDYATWTDSDEMKLRDALSRSNNIIGYNAFLEGININSPRRLLDSWYRTIDIIAWFGRENAMLIKECYKNHKKPDATNIATLTTQNAVGKITTNGVFTHNKIERIPTTAEYIPINSQTAINQLKDINTQMNDECGFGINRIVLPRDVADNFEKANATAHMVPFEVQVKEVLPDAEIVKSNTLLRYGIKHAIVFHKGSTDYDQVCGCKISNTSFKEQKYFDTLEYLVYGVTGGLEVKIPSGIKIITGIKH